MAAPGPIAVVHVSWAARLSPRSPSRARKAASREVLLAYARERLAVEPRIVDGLYCTHVPDAGDGIAFRRSGPVLAVDGENLMKFAPVLGEILAAAAVDGSTPAVPQLAVR